MQFKFEDIFFRRLIVGVAVVVLISTWIGYEMYYPSTEIFGRTITHVNSDQKVVALTFVTVNQLIKEKPYFDK